MVTEDKKHDTYIVLKGGEVIYRGPDIEMAQALKEDWGRQQSLSCEVFTLNN